MQSKSKVANIYSSSGPKKFQGLEFFVPGVVMLLAGLALYAFKPVWFTVLPPQFLGHTMVLAGAIGMYCSYGVFEVVGDPRLVVRRVMGWIVVVGIITNMGILIDSAVQGRIRVLDGVSMPFRVAGGIVLGLGLASVFAAPLFMGKSSGSGEHSKSSERLR
ncbi:hypothetical protein [Ralstonia pseudosolanacearum]|uniref:hypothetical protein n=1 Tax=Ralstonia pseudosolanacearum TaxID=1310165 RepID=UPI003CF158D7